MIRMAGVAFALVMAAATEAQVLPDVPEGAQALTISGEPLVSPAPGEGVLQRLELARADYEADPDNADAIIWYGRRTAYTGDYRGAIRIFSEGVEKFPSDARMLRHRGHRYISIREFDRAIDDLEKAAALIDGTENEVEPDGLPNALNIPVSSLHGNIWYHLGLAYYLKQDWDNAYRAYRAGFEAGRNDDNRVSTTHWMYSILRRKGDEEAAAAVLDAITADMDVIENMSYHNLCLFYKGELGLEALLVNTDGSPAGAAVLYGAANWLNVTGDVEAGTEMLLDIVTLPSWSSFGFIAAETDLTVMGDAE